MEDFINKIIELDNSIEGLEEDFESRKKSKDAELKKSKEDLVKKYDEALKSKKEEFKDEEKKDVEDEEKSIEDLTKKNIDKIKNAYAGKKDSLIEEVFTNHFSEGSD